MRSSRKNSNAAGWDEDGGERTPYWLTLRDRRWDPRPISWLRPAPLIESVNQILATTLSDVVNPRRQRWVAAQRAGGTENLTFTVEQDETVPFSFLLLGDPGEADESQYAVVKPLLAQGEDTKFMVVVSDVIYPAGDINGYIDGFYLPYEDYKKPIYALPGNHDWLDGLNGFMYHFCDAEPLAPTAFASTGLGISGRLARLFWRASSRPHRDLLVSYKTRRPQLQPPQPGPYWAMDVGPVRLVAIDTGVDGSLDRQQGEWLINVSKGNRRKILLTGKPLIVNNKPHPGPIRHELNLNDREHDKPPAFDSVDAVVRHEHHHYLAAIGGDIHNYQRYVLRSKEKQRDLTYMVSGGGGAFLSSTHTLARADRDYDGWRSSEDDFRCYPLRGDSLRHFTRLVRDHGPALGLAAQILFLLLLGAAVIAGTATRADGALRPSSLHPTPGWDLDELGALFALAAIGAFALPLLVIRDWKRALENGLKLAAVAVLVFVAAQELNDPTPWVIAGMVFVPLAHALIRYDRQLFTWVLIGLALLMNAYLVRNTQVAEHAADALAVVATLFVPYLARHKNVLGAAVVAAAAVLLGAFSLSLLLAVLFAVAALLSLGFYFFSGLWAFPFLNVANAMLRALGRICKRDWGRDATPEEAAVWISHARLGDLDTTRDSSAASVKRIPIFWRAAFFLQSPSNRLWHTAQSKFPEIFDSNNPPFFRSFLKIDVDPSAEEIILTCFGATGRVIHENDPPVEDKLVVKFTGEVRSETPA